MNKFRLEFEYDYDFVLIGLSSHEKDYRVCWGVNNSLELDLARGEDLVIQGKKPADVSAFSLYTQELKGNDVEYFLVSNRGATGLLIPEQKQADYFFIARGPFDDDDQEKMINGLRKINFVLTAYRINPRDLKSKQNLAF